MTARELMEWVAYDRLYPIDSEMRNELRNGILTSSIVNTIISVNTKKNSKPKLYKPEDFIVDFVKELEKQERNTLVDKLKAWAYSQNRKK